MTDTNNDCEDGSIIMGIYNSEWEFKKAFIHWQDEVQRNEVLYFNSC